MGPRRSRNAEQGSILVLTALSLVMLLGVTALAVDVSFMYETRNRMAAAADVAAKSASQVLTSGVSIATLQGFARDAASKNGFTHGSGGVTVDVNHPPLYGPFAADNGYVEVIVSRSVPTFFMRLFSRTAQTVNARAVAGGANTPPCLIALDTSNLSGALTISGGGELQVPGCIIDVDSSNAGAITLSGGASITGAGSTVNVMGNPGTNCTGCISGTRNTGVHTDDPYNVPAPTFPANACTTCSAAWPAFCTNSGWKVFGTATVLGSGNHTLDPGIYCHGIDFTGNVTLTSTSTTSPPNFMYILYGTGSGGNAFNMNGTSLTSAGSVGVTFYSTGTGANPYQYGNFNKSSGTMTLDAPASGTYAGILFYQDKNTPTNNAYTVTFTGGGTTTTLNGVIYAPTEKINYSGGGTSSCPTDGSTRYTFLVGKTINTSGGLTLCNQSNGIAGGIFSVAGLVE